MKLTRLEEIAIFCRAMGYKKLGLAHCNGPALGELAQQQAWQDHNSAHSSRVPWTSICKGKA
jgi:carbamate kinase